MALITDQDAKVAYASLNNQDVNTSARAHNLGLWVFETTRQAKDMQLELTTHGFPAKEDYRFGSVKAAAEFLNDGPLENKGQMARLGESIRYWLALGGQKEKLTANKPPAVRFGTFLGERRKAAAKKAAEAKANQTPAKKDTVPALVSAMPELLKGEVADSGVISRDGWMKVIKATLQQAKAQDIPLNLFVHELEDVYGCVIVTEILSAEELADRNEVKMIDEAPYSEATEEIGTEEAGLEMEALAQI